MITNVLTYWVTVEIQKLPGSNIVILHIIKHKYTTMDIMFLYSINVILLDQIKI